MQQRTDGQILADVASAPTLRQSQDGKLYRLQADGTTFRREQAKVRGKAARREEKRVRRLIRERRSRAPIINHGDKVAQARSRELVVYDEVGEVPASVWNPRTPEELLEALQDDGIIGVDLASGPDRTVIVDYKAAVTP